MKTLNHSQLADKIGATKGAAIIGLLALTDCKARKTGNPFGQIFKQVRAVAFVGANYENAVNREGNRQGIETDFTGGQLPWGQWLIANKIIENKGKLYLRTQRTPGNRRKQAAKVLNYRDTSGEFLSRDDVKPFLPVTTESAKQQSAGLAETVWVRTYAFDSLQKIRLNGETFLIKK
jgi:hypothetical protein